MNSRQRRVTAVGIGAGVVVVVITVAFAIATGGGSAAPRHAGSALPAFVVPAASNTSSDLVPAAPVIAVVHSKRIASSAFKVDPSSNAAATDVSHYEVWRHDDSVKTATWEVVENIEAKLLSNRYVYTDPHEQPGHLYSFRVVAVSPSGRSQYNEIHTVATP
jgi:hypothetical protein